MKQNVSKALEKFLGNEHVFVASNPKTTPAKLHKLMKSSTSFDIKEAVILNPSTRLATLKDAIKNEKSDTLVGLATDRILELFRQGKIDLDDKELLGYTVRSTGDNFKAFSLFNELKEAHAITKNTNVVSK